jgi:hypothetical protein
MLEAGFGLSSIEHTEKLDGIVVDRFHCIEPGTGKGYLETSATQKKHSVYSSIPLQLFIFPSGNGDSIGKSHSK